MGYRIALKFSMRKAVHDCRASTSGGSASTMFRVNLFTIAAVLALCVVGAHCSPQTVTQERVSVPITHVDGDTIEILASLTDPTKLDSLTGKRAATPRLRKACYWLHTATDPAEAIEQAQIQNGSQGTSRAQETAKSLLRNLTILERLGCLDDAGLDKLRRGNAPTITKDS